MPPRIAIPMPHSSDPEYAERAIPQYEHAVQLAGGEAVRIPLNLPLVEVGKIIEHCDAVLLPGSKADVDPAKFNTPRSSHTAEADLPREVVDELLLRDAHEKHKPVLGICYGLQSLNVFRGGSLIQHIPDFLPKDLRARVNHEAGRAVAVAHSVEIERESKLGKIIGNGENPKAQSPKSEVRSSIAVPVNSSHHQSAATIGEGLRRVAHCPDDGIVEAVEGTSPDHFVIAVQWHPERSVDYDEPSRAIFCAFVDAAEGS